MRQVSSEADTTRKEAGMEEKQPKPVFGIYVRIENEISRFDDSVCTWIRAQVVHVKAAHDQKFDYASHYNEAQKYYDIALRELIDTKRTPGIGELHAQAGEYDVRELKRLYMTMNELDKKIESINLKFGRAVTFEQHVLRLAAVTGAKWIITQKTGERAQRSGYNYYFLEVGHGYQYVQSDIEEWRKKYSPVKEEVTA
jgi:hypothetical protein